MKKKDFFIVFCVIIVTIIIIGTFKHNIKIVGYTQMTNLSSEFYPNGYRIIFTQQEFDDFCSYSITSKELKKYEECNSLQFDKYGYIVVYGAQIDELWYSWKNTLLDDINPSYAKAYKQGKHFLMIRYKTPDNNVYLYKFKKSVPLKEFITD